MRLLDVCGEPMPVLNVCGEPIPVLDSTYHDFEEAYVLLTYSLRAIRRVDASLLGGVVDLPLRKHLPTLSGRMNHLASDLRLMLGADDEEADDRCARATETALSGWS